MRINLVIQSDHFPELYAQLEAIPRYDRASYIRTLLRDLAGPILQPNMKASAPPSEEDNSSPSSSLMDGALGSHS